MVPDGHSSFSAIVTSLFSLLATHSSSLLRDFPDVIAAIEKVRSEEVKEEREKGGNEGEGVDDVDSAGDGRDGERENESGEVEATMNDTERKESRDQSSVTSVQLGMMFEEKKEEWKEIVSAQVLSMEILTNIFSTEEGEGDGEGDGEREGEGEGEGWPVDVLLPFVRTMMEGVCAFITPNVGGYSEDLRVLSLSYPLIELQNRLSPPLYSNILVSFTPLVLFSVCQMFWEFAVTLICTLSSQISYGTLSLRLFDWQVDGFHLFLEFLLVCQCLTFGRWYENFH
jgi:hypothetical protein